MWGLIFHARPADLELSLHLLTPESQLREVLAQHRGGEGSGVA